MIVVTAAMKPEMDAIRSCLGRMTPLGGGCPAWRSNRGRCDIMAVWTGIGQERVEANLGGLLARHPAEAVVSVGFGGALVPELRSGDIVICAATISLNGTGHCYHADEKLLRRAAGAMRNPGRGWRIGSGLTVPHAAPDAAAKRGLREHAAAEVCEMEDYWIARLAGARGIPFLAVRVVLDSLDAALPDYENIVGADGKLRPLRATAYFLSHPGRLGKVRGSLTDYRRAKASLADFTARFLDSVVR
jgi:adenosylhomocysteine nucleosidase